MTCPVRPYQLNGTKPVNLWRMTDMKKTRLTDEKIIGFLKQADAGMPIKDICRAGRFSQPTFYK